MVRGIFESARAPATAALSTRSRRWAAALTGVAVAYTVVQLALTARIGLGWDESVYLSQVARGVPASAFSAPRARGIPLLLAPVALVTPSVPAIRGYLSLLSGVALLAAYLPWLRLRGGPVVPLAAALFGGLWLSLFYGNEAMPNLWVAFGAVAGTGLCWLAGTGRPAVPAGLVAVFAATSLVRPTDATWLSLPLVGWALAGRRLGTAVAVAAGVTIGWAEWCVEAFLHYGGPIARLRAAGAQNETGLHLTLGEHLRALDGPLLCRYGSPCGAYPVAHIAWFTGLLALAVLGVRVARRRGPALAALASGSTLACGYLLTVGYAAPRFLLPAYALLVLPAAEGLAWLARFRLARPLIVVGLAGYLTLQAATLAGWVGYELRNRSRDGVAAAALRALGLRAPCLVYGFHGVQIGYLARCWSVGVIRSYGGASPPTSIRSALARHARVAVISNRRSPPAAYLASWRRSPIPGTRRWYAFLPPGTAARAASRSAGTTRPQGAGPSRRPE